MDPSVHHVLEKFKDQAQETLALPAMQRAPIQPRAVATQQNVVESNRL